MQQHHMLARQRGVAINDRVVEGKNGKDAKKTKAQTKKTSSDTSTSTTILPHDPGQQVTGNAGQQVQEGRSAGGQHVHEITRCGQ